MNTVMPHIQFVLAAGLIVFLLGAGAATVWWSGAWRRLSRSEAAALACCFFLALLVRLSARAFPADVLMASTQGSVVGNIHQWAAGYSAILHFLYLVFPSDVATASGMNVLLGSATVLAVFAFVDAYFEDRLAAYAACAVLAFQPVSARYAASDSPYVLLTLCLFCACFFLTLWARRGNLLLLLQGAGWLALAANVRHEGAAYGAIGALILAGCLPRPSRQSLRQLGAAAAAYAVFLVYPVSRLLTAVSLGTADNFSFFGVFEAFFLSSRSPGLIVLLAVVGALWAARAMPRRCAAFLGALAVASLPVYFIADALNEMSNRHTLPHLAGWCVFAGLGLRAVAGRRSLTALSAAAALVLAAGSAVPHRAFLGKMWTHALEYDFIVKNLRAIPDDCVIISPGPRNDWQIRGLRIPRQMSWEAGKRHEWLSAADGEAEDVLARPCAVFYRATTCFAYEPDRLKKPDWQGPERPVCRQMAERFRLEALATTTIPAIPYASEAYTLSPLPAGFYRLWPKEKDLSPRHPGR